MMRIIWFVAAISVLDLIPYWGVPKEYRDTVGMQKLIPGGGAWMYLSYMAQKQPKGPTHE